MDIANAPFYCGALEADMFGGLLWLPTLLVKRVTNSYLDYGLYLWLTLLAIGCDYYWSTVQYCCGVGIIATVRSELILVYTVVV